MTEEITIVDDSSKEIIPVPVEDDKSDVTKETPNSAVSDDYEGFTKLIREHIITVIKRMDPESRGYYEMIWEEQTFDQLLAYKLLKVHKNKNAVVEEKDDTDTDASAVSLVTLDMTVK